MNEYTCYYCKDCKHIRLLAESFKRGYVHRPHYKFSCFLRNQYVEEYDEPCRDFALFRTPYELQKELAYNEHIRTNNTNLT